MNDVILLGKTTCNALMISPEQVLAEVQRELKENTPPLKKLIVITLNEADGHYDINWRQAGMKISEIIALLELAKHTMIEEMGY